jgi:hypothetical protein
MLGRLQSFDRPDHTLVIDTRSGQRVVTRIPKTPFPQQAPLPQRQPGEGPNLARKVLNLGKAKAKRAATGFKNASAKTLQRRWEICVACPSGLFRQLPAAEIHKNLLSLPIVGTCTHKTCGCYMHPTATTPNKLLYASEACPRGHWGPAE